MRSELSQFVGSASQWEIEVIGPGTWDFEQFVTDNQKWNSQFIGSDCPKLGPIQSGSPGQEYKPASPSNGYATIENLDAGLYSDDNAQSVYFYSPYTVGTSQNASSALVNNVRTDGSSFYILQDGLYFISGTGWVVWANSGTVPAYSINQFSTERIPYVASHAYWFTLTFTSGTWFMCANDYNVPNGASYTCQDDSHAIGTTIVSDFNTSIFAENHNTNTSWYQGFSSPLRAIYAKIYRTNGLSYRWGNEHFHTQDACATNWPPASAITGSLTNGGNGYFQLSGVPLKC